MKRRWLGLLLVAGALVLPAISSRAQEGGRTFVLIVGVDVEARVPRRRLSLQTF